MLLRQAVNALTLGNLYALLAIGLAITSIAGAIVLTVAPVLFRFLAEYRMVIYGALLGGLMVFRPQGLLGGINLGLTRRPV
jgi:branched-chain amino acid transport system permease protein